MKAHCREKIFQIPENRRKHFQIKYLTERKKKNLPWGQEESDTTGQLNNNMLYTHSKHLMIKRKITQFF